MSEDKEKFQITEDDYNKLKHENEALKNRCFVLSQGVMCSFCKLECKYTTRK